MDADVERALAGDFDFLCMAAEAGIDDALSLVPISDMYTVTRCKSLSLIGHPEK